MPLRLVVRFVPIGALKTNSTLVLDVTFGEDASRIRTKNSPENFALLRRMAVSLLNQETSSKRSLRQKAKRAAMDSNYMLQVLATALPQ